MHENSRLLFTRFARSYFKPGLRVLEIGPDQFPSAFQIITQDMPLTWHTVDIAQHPKLTYIARDEYSFPIPDESYDIVVSGSVIEHVRKIWAWMKELSRICKTGGHIITVNPISWTYHPAPFDCWRIFPEGMKALYDDAGFDVLHSSFTSLEAPHARRDIPGISVESQSRKRRMFYQVMGRLGFPVERAYDTITIGIKRAHEPGRSILNKAGETF